MAGIGMNTAMNDLLSPRDLATGTGSGTGSGAAKTTLRIKFYEYEGGVDWKKVGHSWAHRPVPMPACQGHDAAPRVPALAVHTASKVHHTRLARAFALRRGQPC